MDQYQYTLKQTSEDREKKIQACLQNSFIEHCKTFQNEVWTAYKAEEQRITASFESAVSDGAAQAKGMIENGEKGPVQYIHFSYLGSNILADEMLVKLDFYDKRHFSDLSDIDCYWNYHLLFPNYAKEQKTLERMLNDHITRLTPLELQRVLIFYQVWNFMALEEVIRCIVKTKPVEQILCSCSDHQILILFGAYLDQAERIHKLEG